jgi:hypothetical protein
MPIEIRQLVIRAVVPSATQSPPGASEDELVARCVRVVLRQLDRQKER